MPKILEVPSITQAEEDSLVSNAGTVIFNSDTQLLNYNPDGSTYLYLATQSNIDSLNSDIENLNDAIDNTNDNVSDLQSQVSDLSDEVNALPAIASTRGGIAYTATGSSGVTGTPAVYTSFENRIGEVVTGNFGVTFTPSAPASTVILNFTKFYGQDFGSPTDCTGLGVAYLISTPTTTPGTVEIVEADVGSPRIIVNIAVTDSGTHYALISFSYFATP